MKFCPKKYTIILLIIAAILFLGYYRDFIFITVNSVIQSKEYNTAYTSPSSLSFLDVCNYATLMSLKWLLTIMFSIAYLLITLATLRIIFNEKKYNRVAVGAYVCIAIVSGLFMLSGYLFTGVSDRMYEFARYLMGMAQSPVILMILIPAFKLSRHEPNDITN